MNYEKILTRKIRDLTWKHISHGEGRKKVFFQPRDFSNPLTQFAFGELQPGQSCSPHKHPTMEEYFYFFSGVGIYVIDGKECLVSPGTFSRIPADTFHHLECRGKTSLCFVYFGVALVEKQVEK